MSRYHKFTNRLGSGACAGFTLIELLVVIAVLSMLVSLLIPSVFNARDQALEVGCLSNKRQQVAAILLFASDHQGFAPGAGDLSGRGIGQYVMLTDAPNNKPKSILVRLGYTSGFEIFQCPGTMKDRKALYHDYFGERWNRNFCMMNRYNSMFVGNKLDPDRPHLGRYFERNHDDDRSPAPLLSNNSASKTYLFCDSVHNRDYADSKKFARASHRDKTHVGVAWSDGHCTMHPIIPNTVHNAFRPPLWLGRL